MTLGGFIEGDEMANKENKYADNAAGAFFVDT